MVLPEKVTLPIAEKGEDFKRKDGMAQVSCTGSIELRTERLLHAHRFLN